MKGHTILEILIAVSILCLLSAGVFSILYVGDSMFRSDMGILDLQEETRRAMDGISREIRQAKNSDVSITESGTAIDFIIPTDITTETTTYSDTISFYLNGEGQIMREQPLGKPIVAANNIESLQFSCCDDSGPIEDCSAANSLQILIQAKKIKDRKPIVFNLEEKITMRN